MLVAGTGILFLMAIGWVIAKTGELGFIPAVVLGLKNVVFGVMGIAMFYYAVKLLLWIGEKVLTFIF